VDVREAERAETAAGLMNTEVLRALSTCDVLFGCMDSVDGRHVLNKLASAYVIPLIDLGVTLDADGAGGIDSIWSAHDSPGLLQPAE